VAGLLDLPREVRGRGGIDDHLRAWESRRAYV